MRRLLAVAAFFVSLTVVGCSSWQANNASEAVDFNPFAVFSGESVFSPANGPGYSNGDSLDMRTKH
jgi:hypothetical protein